MTTDTQPTSPLQRLRAAVDITNQAWDARAAASHDPHIDRRALTAEWDNARTGVHYDALALIASLSPSPGTCPVVAEWIPIASDCEMPGEGQVIVMMAGPKPWLAVAEWRDGRWISDGTTWDLAEVLYWLKITLPPMVPKET